jgi:putative NADPH-quinone reductase
VTKCIALVVGHPDPRPERFDRALAAAYEAGAIAAGHEVRCIDVAALDFPLLRRRDDWEHGTAPDAIRGAQQTVEWADHLVIIYPLWLGAMPALLKAFLEQIFRPGFAFAYPEGKGLPRKLLKGRSARVVVTMGMPAILYRWFFRAHSVKSLKRNILAFCGFGPVRVSLVGSVEGADAARRRWLAGMHALGRAAR